MLQTDRDAVFSQGKPQSSKQPLRDHQGVMERNNQHHPRVNVYKGSGL